MTTAKVALCSCGGTPEFSVYRGGEDFMEAKGVCPKCGLESDPIEHVWGGTEARLMAVGEWNRMRAEEPDKKPVKVCEGCGGVGCLIVGNEYGPTCTACGGRGTVEVLCLCGHAPAAHGPNCKACLGFQCREFVVVDSQEGKATK